jgi:DNA repair exonuclease SbcCD ATPase subunit
MTDKIKRLQEQNKKNENIIRFADKTIEKQEKEIERLNVELVGMRGACESYKMHYDKAQAEIERLKKVRANILKVMKENISQTKSEAIKEFAEELSLDIQRHLMPNVGDDGTVTVENAERYFLKRIKEMTETQETQK